MQISPRRQLWTGLIGLLWFSGVIILYYYWHKPITPEVAVRLVGICWQLLVAMLITAASGGVGRRLLPARSLPPLARLAVQSALGYGIFGIVLLAGSQVLGTGLLFLGGLLGISLLCFIRDIRGWLADWKEMGEIWLQADRFGRSLAAGLALIFVVTLITSLAPPLKFDALVYHLTLPHRYLEAGRLVYVPEIMFWGMPQTGEMLYTWAIGLGGDPAAGVLGWTFGFLSVAGLVSWVRSRLGLRAAWVSAASLIAGYTLSTALAWAYIDWLTTFFGLSFLICLERWRDSAKQPWLVAAGLMAGMAFGTKYSAGVLWLAGMIYLLGSGRNACAWANRLRYGLVFSLAAGAMAFPWLLKNLLATGNPFYPLFFPAGAMDALRLELYQGGQPWGGWLDLLILPLRATFLGIEGKVGYSASIGPLFLALGGLAWIGFGTRNPEAKSTIVTAAWIAVPVLALWAIAGRFTGYLLQSRLYFSIYPALAVLAAAGLTGLRTIHIPGLRLERIAAVLAALVLWLNVVEVGLNGIDQGALPVLTGARTTEEYLDHNLGVYAPAARAMSALPEGARVLMLWETRSLYCAPKCIPDEVIDRWLRDRAAYGEAEDILEAWRAEGYTHLLYYRLGAEYIQKQNDSYQAEDWGVLEELLSTLPELNNFWDAYHLYELNQ